MSSDDLRLPNESLDGHGFQREPLERVSIELTESEVSEKSELPEFSELSVLERVSDCSDGTSGDLHTEKQSPKNLDPEPARRRRDGRWAVLKKDAERHPRGFLVVLIFLVYLSYFAPAAVPYLLGFEAPDRILFYCSCYGLMLYSLIQHLRTPVGGIKKRGSGSDIAFGILELCIPLVIFACLKLLVPLSVQHSLPSVLGEPILYMVLLWICCLVRLVNIRKRRKGSDAGSNEPDAAISQLPRA